MLSQKNKCLTGKHAIFSTALISAIITVSLFLLLYRGAYPSPFSDEFYFYKLYADAASGTITLIEIIKPHFGHLFIIPKLLLWLTVKLGIDWRVNMYLGSILIAATAGLTAHLILIEKKSILKYPFAIAAALIIGSARQAENLYWGMQLSTALTVFFTFTAFFLVEKFQKTQNTKFAVFAIISATICLLANGSGVISFGLTIFGIWISGKGAARVRAITFTAFIVGILLFSTIHLLFPDNSGPASPSLLTGPNIFKYFFAFFSSSLFSFTPRGDDTKSLLLGAIILFVAGRLLWASKRQWRTNLFPLLLVAFSLLCCFLIAIARLKNGIYQPNASRYYPFTMPLIIGNLILFARTEPASKNKKFIGLASVLLVLFFCFSSYVTEWHISPYRYSNISDAHIRLCDGEQQGLVFFGDLKSVDLNIIRKTFCRNTAPKSSANNTPPIILLEFGPNETTSGTKFNVQPNGESAIWAKTQNANSTCFIVFDGHKLRSVVDKSGALITAEVPKSLYEKPGNYLVYIECISRSGSLPFMAK